MIKWPPNKAWTRIKPNKGYIHFVAINYGGVANKRWVNLVSVLDGNLRSRVFWKEINDNSKWISGWIENIDQCSVNSVKEKKSIDESNSSSVCLLPSNDSGLNIPMQKKSIRPW